MPAGFLPTYCRRPAFWARVKIFTGACSAFPYILPSLICAYAGCRFLDGGCDTFHDCDDYHHRGASGCADLTPRTWSSRRRSLGSIFQLAVQRQALGFCRLGSAGHCPGDFLGGGLDTARHCRSTVRVGMHDV